MQQGKKFWIWLSRVSTDYQHVDAQRAAYERFVKEHPEEEVILREEVVSGRRMKGEYVKELWEWVEKGLVKGVACYAYDRLGRSVLEGLKFVDHCLHHQVKVHSEREPWNLETPEGRLGFTMVMAFAEYYLGRISAGTAMGLARAKERGTFKGGSEGKWLRKDTAAKVPDVLKLKDSGFGVMRIVEMLGMDFRTVSRIIKNRDALPEVRKRVWDSDN